MKYRIDKEGLFDIIRTWDSFLKKKVHLITCGGTALTLLGIKASTKDIDFIVPELSEYKYLLNILQQIGYKSKTGTGWARDDNFIFDLFIGNRVHTTELLDSPLDKEKHILLKEFSYIYLGILNYYDLIISKLFRGTGADMEDCLSLMKSKAREIDLNFLIKRFRETASYDISEDKVNKNLDYFLEMLKKEGFINGQR
ncbi:MAG: hypothetical protein AUJ85_09260 [Elusimicrobia bacterium CG1_02_37_114]|nr:MAG: hypothetical protein AUJ85_09260 [Elusimicrobia bacterium CG1_02_37_114]PIV53949.1 MAG: hypothetical protein COS17_01200 [Elusimicrobia bacterium CG02_land_8_20_14_3_00_37_13]PIZ14055.1 MAG: hypothetical protein COY53_01620 [Elusimicrobia bacterium CG_4_10_14_0_8_um_filter_37_32]